MYRVNRVSVLFFLITVWGALLTGCAETGVYEDAPPRRILFIQTGIMVKVLNLCQFEGVIHTTTGATYNIGPGATVDVPMIPMPLTDSASFGATFVVIQRGEQGTESFVGSVSRTFYRYQRTYTVQWIIGGRQSHGGGSNIFIDYPRGSDGRPAC